MVPRVPSSCVSTQDTMAIQYTILALKQAPQPSKTYDMLSSISPGYSTPALKDSHTSIMVELDLWGL